MIIWLASYPKSGNTYLRSILAAYFYSKDGNFNFNLLKNFIQFPNKYVFDKLGLDLRNHSLLSENYIEAQNYINKLKMNRINFVKTHSSCVSLNGNEFTNFKNTLGVIYIVRDPRNILTSYSHHFQKSLKNSLDDMFQDITLAPNSNKHAFSFVGSWRLNYESWKKFDNHKKYLLIKYEDLLQDTEKTTIKVLEFVHKISNLKFVLEKDKLQMALKTTEFDQMQALEKKNGFVESKVSKVSGQKINFFHLGKKNNWKNLLPENFKKKIENQFRKEMKELRYL